MNKKKFDYKVQVWIPNVDSVELQQVFPTKLIRDPEDKLLYLIDIKTKGKAFKELFPSESKKAFSVHELPKLKKELDKIKTKKRDAKKDDIKNPLNYDKKIYELEYLISQCEQKTGSFTKSNEKGEKLVDYIRKSSGMFAINLDIHSNKAFSPTESQSKDTFLMWKQKYENLKKDTGNSIEKITAITASIVLVILVAAAAIFVYNIAQYSNELEKAIVEQKFICQAEAIKEMQEINEQNRQASKNYVNWVSGIMEDDPSKVSPDTRRNVGEVN